MTINKWNMILAPLCITLNVASFSVDIDFYSFSAAFSISHSGPVLEAKESNNQRTMGQRIAPTHLDILAMNKRYQCFGNNNRCEKILIAI
jgi:hypothetical protein